MEAARVPVEVVPHQRHPIMCGPAVARAAWLPVGVMGHRQGNQAQGEADQKGQTQQV